MMNEPHRSNLLRAIHFNRVAKHVGKPIAIKLINRMNVRIEMAQIAQLERLLTEHPPPEEKKDKT